MTFIYLLFNRPSIVFGMGGYSSFPVCIAATILRIKFVIYENNLIIGKANKYLLPFAKKIFVSYKDLEGIPKKYDNKIIVSTHPRTQDRLKAVKNIEIDKRVVFLKPFGFFDYLNLYDLPSFAF